MNKSYVEQLPSFLQELMESDNVQYEINGEGLAVPYVDCPADAYTLVLILRWILEIDNEDWDAALQYQISWELAESRCSDVSDVRIFADITQKRSGETTQREIATLESFSKGVYVVRFTEGTFGSFRYSGPQGLWRLLDDAIHAPHPQLQPYCKSHSFAVMDGEGDTRQLRVMDPDGYRPGVGFSIKLGVTLTGCKVSVIKA